MDQTPFKECYWCIPLNMYDDVRAHIQGMLDIGAIWKSHRPWASAVVLALNSSLPLKQSWDTGRSRWVRKVNH